MRRLGRDRRLGSGFVNRVVDPILLERGLSGAGRSEIGTLEHIGRTSGTRRLTPVHPVPTETGFRIIVPLGDRSEWARMPGISPVARWLGSLLGFDYLVLRSFSGVLGSLIDPQDQAPATPRERLQKPRRCRPGCPHARARRSERPGGHDPGGRPRGSRMT